MRTRQVYPMALMVIAVLFLLACAKLDSTKPSELEGVEWNNVSSSLVSSSDAVSPSSSVPVSSSDAVSPSSSVPVSSSDAVSSSSSVPVSSSDAVSSSSSTLLLYSPIHSDTTALGGDVEVHYYDDSSNPGTYTFDCTLAGGETHSTANFPDDFSTCTDDLDGIKVRVSLTVPGAFGVLGVQFRFQEGDDMNPYPYDLSARDSVCITYQSDTSLVLKFRSTLEPVTQGKNYQYLLPEQPGNYANQCIPFSDFFLPGWVPADDLYDFDQTSLFGLQVLIFSDCTNCDFFIKEIQFR